MRSKGEAPKPKNKKLLAAWVAMLSAVFAAGALGYGLGTSATPPPLVFGDDICSIPYWTDRKSDSILYVCQQGEREYLVVPLTR